jgi:hypothetical protein
MFHKRNGWQGSPIFAGTDSRLLKKWASEVRLDMLFLLRLENADVQCFEQVKQDFSFPNVAISRFFAWLTGCDFEL